MKTINRRICHTIKVVGYCLLVIVAAACSDDEDYSMSTSAVITSITTDDASVTAISATTYGTVQNLSAMASSSYQVGSVYSTGADPTVGGTRQIGSIDSNGKVTAVLSGLKEGTTYYYATFVTLQGKVTKYGDVKSFVATDADVATAAASDITACSAVLNGQASGIGDILEVSAVGFKYALTEEGVATGVDVPLAETTSTFTEQVKSLLPGTTYYYAAYTKVGDGFILGNVQRFTTAVQEMEYVDMGLSVLWAKCNIGAEKESEAGILLGFGDQSFYNASTSNDDYTPWDIAGTDDDTINGLSIDGSAKSKSKMPTIEQIEELIAKTTQEQATVDGVEGIRFTAQNGNSIFLPFGSYWSGTINEINDAYSKTLKVAVDGAAAGLMQRAIALSIRSVRDEEPVEEGITIRNYNAVQGDIEGNGNYRYDIYNEWDGSGTGTDDTSVLIRSEVDFKESISVTFTITGIGSTECQATMIFADGTWGCQNWGYNDNGEGSVMVKGDGTYSMTLHGAGSGVAIFAIDFIGLSNAVGAENINVKLNTCVMDDWGTKLAFDNAKLVTGDIEGNGNFRADIYNEWDGSGTGSDETCGVDRSAVNFSKRIGVTFVVSGIGDTECDACMIFADGTWGCQNWGYNADGNGSVHITGDGIYSMSLAGAGSGIAIFAIDLLGLSNVVGAENVKVRVSCIRVE
ncbi:MAG: hypothetical protein J6W43_04530 [Prevotella sp.]|nr:hypothetical protein [Prevotella sp.]